MDTSNLIKKNFIRDDSSYEDMLDDYWTIEVKGLAKSDEKLSEYFESVDYSDVDISIAGKESGLNDAAFQLALEVLPDLHLYLREISSKVQLETENGWWHLTSIWFPYQQESMWYLHFTSDYGSDLEYCFVKDKETNEFVGLVSGCRDNDSIAHVLPTVKYVVNELVRAKVYSPAFRKVRATIKAEETIGRELIAPLIQIVTESKEVLRDYMYDHLLKLLGEIKCNAVKNVIKA